MSIGRNTVLVSATSCVGRPIVSLLSSLLPFPSPFPYRFDRKKFTQSLSYLVWLEADICHRSFWHLFGHMVP
jgi:hypothetical protein